MSESVRKALLNVEEWSGLPSECREGPSGYPGVVDWPSQIFRSSQLALPNVLEWSGGTPG